MKENAQRTKSRHGPVHDENLAALDGLIEEITVDAYGDDEKLWAFRQVFEDNVALPADGFVIGEPVSVVEIDYDGDQRRGLTAKCLRDEGAMGCASGAWDVMTKLRVTLTACFGSIRRTTKESGSSSMR